MLDRQSPSCGEMQEVDDQGRTQLAYHHRRATLLKADDYPGKNLAENLFGLGLIQGLPKAGISKRYLGVLPRDKARDIRLGVQLDSKGQSSEELNLFIVAMQEAIGELPSFW